MSKVLTSRQQQVLEFIEFAQESGGVTPTTREIQEHFGFASQTAAMNHLRALEKKGAISRQAGKARALAVVPKFKREIIVDIPLYGQIAAGYSEVTQQENDSVISVDSSTLGLSRKSRIFALKVRGESMIGAQIKSGDLVIMESREPKNGDIVAALIDGETTLKRFIFNDGTPYLKSENPEFPNLLPIEELIVQGVMVALIRKCRE